jgi:hypothetical protein
MAKRGLYPIVDSKLHRRFCRILSCLAHWSPVGADVALRESWIENDDDDGGEGNDDNDQNTDPSEIRGDPIIAAGWGKPFFKPVQKHRYPKSSSYHPTSHPDSYNHFTPLLRPGLIPGIVYPFIRLIQNDVICFETIVTIIINICYDWFDTLPGPPPRVMSRCELLLYHFDPELYSHFHSLGIAPETWYGVYCVLL